MSEKTYAERMQALRAEIPQGGTKSSKATTTGPTPTDTELVRRKIAAAQRRAEDRAAAEAAGVLDPLRPPKTTVPKSTYTGKTPADAVPRFLEELLGEEGIERSRAEEAAELYDWSTEDVATVIEGEGEPAPMPGKINYQVNQQGLELSGEVGAIHDDPQAIADAADDYAAQYIYEDTPAEDVPDAADLDYQDERERAGPEDGSREMAYAGDGPGGEGAVYFYEDAEGGGQRGYWLRDDGSVVNVTNILFPPSG